MLCFLGISIISYFMLNLIFFPCRGAFCLFWESFSVWNLIVIGSCNFCSDSFSYVKKWEKNLVFMDEYFSVLSILIIGWYCCLGRIECCDIIYRKVVWTRFFIWFVLILCCFFFYSSWWILCIEPLLICNQTNADRAGWRYWYSSISYRKNFWSVYFLAIGFCIFSNIPGLWN